MRTIAAWFLMLALVSSASFAEGRRRLEQGRAVSPTVPPQQNLIERKTGSIDPGEYSGIFRFIERGIGDANVGSFSQYFGTQVYVGLAGGESGYYSANQAYYVLQSYLASRRIHSVRLTYYGVSDSVPYATGQGRSDVRGAAENVQVYVALSRVGNQWVVSQISIY